MVLGGRAPLADGTGLSVLGPAATLAWLWVKSTSRGSISRGVLRPELSGILRLALLVRAAVAEGGLRWSTCSRTESFRGRSGVGRRPRSRRGEGRGATPWAARRSATSRRTSSAARELGPSPRPLPGVRSSCLSGVGTPVPVRGRTGGTKGRRQGALVAAGLAYGRLAGDGSCSDAVDPPPEAADSHLGRVGSVRRLSTRSTRSVRASDRSVRSPARSARSRSARSRSARSRSARARSVRSRSARSLSARSRSRSPRAVEGWSRSARGSSRGVTRPLWGAVGDWTAGSANRGTRDGSVACPSPRRSRSSCTTSRAASFSSSLFFLAASK
mmetsp:Transcript_36941/g.96677  ORF Transcript_36941/g.96677 Transcript_36941/m.96677 type:complete len:329 (+) Transcript_36941:486-1472(+)